VKAFLEKKFKGKLEISIEATPNTSGAFEVTDVASKTLLHSKLGGGGFVQGKALVALNAAIAKLL
jgi:selT/selW/selH-like putative selenoprotein